MAGKKPCPKCSSKAIIPIVYGLPNNELGEKEKQGKLKLGGCCIELDAPEFFCKDCEYQWSTYGSIKGGLDMFIKVTEENLNELVPMALELWPDNTYEGLKEDLADLLKSEKHASFLYQSDGENVGFIQLSTRHDYVEGSDSSPVGYVEGIYVKPEYRGKNIAKEMITHGEQWALSKGCTQMASDVEQHNTVSYEFHKRIGFKEANRLICFIKDIGE